MEALFLKLLNLSMNAGWLILAVVVLRLIFRRAPRWAFCLLWGLAALRLVCPVTIESVVSLIPSAQPLPDNIIYTATPAINSGVPPIDSVVNPILENTLTVSNPALPVSANPTQIWSFLLSCVWILGVAVMLGYALVSYLLLRRRVATATLLRDNIKQSERVDSPFVLGLLRPTIYLPYAMDEADMGHVISHERAHIRRGDHWWKPLGFLILSVYWFNPLVWAAYILFCRDMELACDEKVAANLAHEERQAYSTALLHCGVRRRTVAACPLAFGEVGVKSRVKSVMHYKKPAFWVVLIAVVACIVAAVCFLTVPKDEDPHTLEVTGLPAPESGKDPYENLEPAKRAAAFLANADKLSYELDPIRMYGTYLVPVQEYVPGAADTPTDPESAQLIVELSQGMLDHLHEFDLSTLTSMEIEEYTPEFIESAVIHVGDARCRMTIWYEKEADGGLVPTGPLVFTFADGTMCAFDGGEKGEKIDPLYTAISLSNSGLGFTLQENQAPWGSKVTVTELATGERKNLNASSAAYVECVFENTPLLSEQVKSEAEFPWKIEIRNGGTYWYNPEQKLLMTENNKVYAIGGFEPAFSGDTKSELLELMLPGSILSPFGYQVSGSLGGTIRIEPPGTNPDPTESIVSTNPSEEDLRQKYPEYFDLNTAKGLEVYVWKTAENSYHCGVLPGTNRNKTDEEISRLSTNGASIEEMKLILSSYDISDDRIILMPYSPSNSSHFFPLDDTDIRAVNTSFGYNAAGEIQPPASGENPDKAASLQEIAVNELNLDASSGVGVEIAFESEHMLIFYGSFGLFGYDLDSNKLLFSVDFVKAIGIEGSVQGSRGPAVEVSEDGRTILISDYTVETETRGTTCCIDVPTLTYTRGMYRPLLRVFQRDTAKGYVYPGVKIRQVKYVLNDKEWNLFVDSTVTKQPEDDTNWALQQAVWQATVDGSLSPQEAAEQIAQKVADNYLALPDGTSWRPEDIRVTAAKVFDNYWGETPQFCFRIGLDVKMTQEMMMSIHWGAWGNADEDGDGWWPYGAEVHVWKTENGTWSCDGFGTGGSSVMLSDGEGLAYLVDCFWLTEGWTHDWRLPYTILDMTDEQLKELPALLDQRTEAEAKKFCVHLGGMLREYDYWVQTTESLKPILGRYGTYLDA